MSYPSDLDLRDLLSAAGAFSPETLLQIDSPGAIGAAVAEWELSTGWLPFLATDQTRVFQSPSGSVLDLDGGLLSLTSLSVGGTAYMAGNQFLLFPYSGPPKGLPYEHAEFISRPGGDITIVGVWGRMAVISPDVFRAVLAKAALLVLPELSVATTGGKIAIQEGDVREEYARAGVSGPFAAQEAAWTNQFERAVKIYKRVTI